MFESLAVTYTYTTTQSSTAHSTVNAGLYFMLAIILLVLVVISVVAMWKIFTKAGRPGWAAIVPIYNTWVLFEISGKPGWWCLSVLLAWIPFVGWLVYFVLYVLAMLELAKRFGKDTTFAVLGLIIFSFVGLLMLGFGKDKYHAAPTGPSGPSNTPPQTPMPPASA